MDKDKILLKSTQPSFKLKINSMNVVKVETNRSGLIGFEVPTECCAKPGMNAGGHNSTYKLGYHELTRA